MVDKLTLNTPLIITSTGGLESKYILQNNMFTFHSHDLADIANFREPSFIRETWTIRLIADAILRRMVMRGILTGPIIIMLSKRATASRGVLACRVDIEPLWPVFIACNISKVSSPRHSPIMILSGRIRRS